MRSFTARSLRPSPTPAPMVEEPRGELSRTTDYRTGDSVARLVLRAPRPTRALVVALVRPGWDLAIDPTVLALLRRQGIATGELDLPVGSDWRALCRAIQRAAREPEAQGRPLGVYGAGEAALVGVPAAAETSRLVGALVLRDPLLPVDPDLPAVLPVPVLSLVARPDGNRVASARRVGRLVRHQRRLVLVARAGRSSGNPAAPASVAGLASRWFHRQLMLGESER